MEQIDNKTSNVIIVDADYIDKVAFDLIVNFERMINRHIPQADMAQWVECVGIDGGMQEGEDATTVILIHDKSKASLVNFAPSAYDELNGKAFSGKYGEFAFVAIATDEDSETMTKNIVFNDVLAAMADEPQVRRVMAVSDLDAPQAVTSSGMMPILKYLDKNTPEKRVTVFAMQPLTGLPCRQEILGYSLMAALGIRAEEINARL